MKDIHKYGLLLLSIFLVGVGLFHQEKVHQIRVIKQEVLKDAQKRFFSSQSAFDKLSQNFYNDYNDYLARVLHAVQSPRESSQPWREELLDRLFPVYRSVTLFGLNQFQIIDRSGRSFLRFHYREHYGDDLSALRPSVRMELESKRFLKGFESGRFVDGLRYIYPLFYDGEFVGSYEWVWNHETLIRELRRIYGGRYAIVVLDREMDRLILDPELTRQYAIFGPCREYRYHRNAFRLYGPAFPTFMGRLFEKRGLCARLEWHESFVVRRQMDGNDYLVRVVALHTIAGTPYGFFIDVEVDERIAGIEHLFYVETALLLLVLLLIYLLLWRSYRDRIFVRTLLDSQRDIVILTNGRRISDANRTFLEFFKVATLEEFVERYECICNLFIEAEGFVGKTVEGVNWLEWMKRQGPESRVIMFDRQRGEERTFMVSLNRFDNTGLYVVAFRDITELEREKRHFKIESMMDHLTGLYNKRSFEHYLQDRLKDIRRFGQRRIALVMFDIDYFKVINDSYGHQRGDEVLQRLAKLVRNHMRQSDFLARWGGEEFIIVMDGADARAACRKAEALRRLIAESEFGIPEGLSCSFGATQLQAEDTPESALERVDRLLYRAKEAGRNRVVCDENEVDSR